MLDIIKNALGLGASIDYKSLKENGALVIDVRSRQEFKANGNSEFTNIPLDELDKKISDLKKQNKTIITCCVSGARSGAAKRKLKSAGIEEVYNGGNWSSLSMKLSV